MAQCVVALAYTVAFLGHFIGALNPVNRQLDDSDGVAGVDYPTYRAVPKNLRFYCSARQPGFYADPDTDCQVWHLCDMFGRRHSFLCPNKTVFNQLIRGCDWWYNVDCESSTDLYGNNDDLYRENRVGPPPSRPVIVNTNEFTGRKTSDEEVSTNNVGLEDNHVASSTRRSIVRASTNLPDEEKAEPQNPNAIRPGSSVRPGSAFKVVRRPITSTFAPLVDEVGPFQSFPPAPPQRFIPAFTATVPPQTIQTEISVQQFTISTPPRRFRPAQTTWPSSPPPPPRQQSFQPGNADIPRLPQPQPQPQPEEPFVDQGVTDEPLTGPGWTVRFGSQSPSTFPPVANRPTSGLRPLPLEVKDPNAENAWRLAVADRARNMNTIPTTTPFPQNDVASFSSSDIPELQTFPPVATRSTFAPFSAAIQTFAPTFGSRTSDHSTMPSDETEPPIDNQGFVSQAFIPQSTFAPVQRSSIPPSFGSKNPSFEPSFPQNDELPAEDNFVSSSTIPPSFRDRTIPFWRSSSFQNTEAPIQWENTDSSSFIADSQPEATLSPPLPSKQWPLSTRSNSRVTVTIPPTTFLPEDTFSEELSSQSFSDSTGFGFRPQQIWQSTTPANIGSPSADNVISHSSSIAFGSRAFSQTRQETSSSDIPFETNSVSQSLPVSLAPLARSSPRSISNSRKPSVWFTTPEFEIDETKKHTAQTLSPTDWSSVPPPSGITDWSTAQPPRVADWSSAPPPRVADWSPAPSSRVPNWRTTNFPADTSEPENSIDQTDPRVEFPPEVPEETTPDIATTEILRNRPQRPSSAWSIDITTYHPQRRLPEITETGTELGPIEASSTTSEAPQTPRTTRKRVLKSRPSTVIDAITTPIPTTNTPEPTTTTTEEPGIPLQFGARIKPKAKFFIDNSVAGSQLLESTAVLNPVSTVLIPKRTTTVHAPEGESPADDLLEEGDNSNADGAYYFPPVVAASEVDSEINLSPAN